MEHDTDTYLHTVEADGYTIYVRRAANGSILVDVDTEGRVGDAPVPPLILSADDFTYRNDEEN